MKNCLLAIVALGFFGACASVFAHHSIAMFDNDNSATLTGTVQKLPATSFNIHLQAQNALRATASLPPIPDPTTVTHTNPAVASGRASVLSTHPMNTPTATTHPGPRP